jgi:hypothetical protein
MPFFPITSTVKYKTNLASEWLAHLILNWKHQFQIPGCKVAVSTDCFVVLHSLSSKILGLPKTRPRLFPSTSSPIQHSLIIVLFNTIVYSYLIKNCSNSVPYITTTKSSYKIKVYASVFRWRQPPPSGIVHLISRNTVDRFYNATF